MSQPESLRRTRVLIVFGTRPEAVKMAPLYHALKGEKKFFEVRIAVTAQHRELLDQALADFGISADHDLDIMRENQDLYHITASALEGLGNILGEFDPHCVLVQGDTTTTFIGALSAFYRKIPVGHVEAGLRTGRKYAPYPEEINRRLTGCLADLHYAPTLQARENLLAEGVRDEAIEVTGNTGIDALLWILANRPSQLKHILSEDVFRATQGRFILLTTHRRESFGTPMANTLAAVRVLAERFPEVAVIFPVHPNPNVRREAERVLADIKNVHLTAPLDYVNFCHLMSLAEIILTDSGGIQEEAPSLSRPVLILRDTTERPEGINAGVAKLVGTNQEKIIEEVTLLLTDKKRYQAMTSKANPYGDGHASGRIVESLKRRLL